MPFPGVRSLIPIALTSWATLVYAQKAELPLKHAPQPTTPAITAGDLMTRLYIFADDSMMGREVGTQYHLKATAYIEREVRRLGLVPGGDNGTYFQNLPVFDHPLAAGNTITVDGKTFSARDGLRAARQQRVRQGPQLRRRPGDLRRRVRRHEHHGASPRPPTGKFVVMSVPNGPDGKPDLGRQSAAAHRLLPRLGRGRRRRASTPSIEATRAQLLEPAQTFKGDDSDAPTVPSFMYITQAMGEALMGAPLAGMTRGAPGTHDARHL